MNLISRRTALKTALGGVLVATSAKALTMTAPALSFRSRQRWNFGWKFLLGDPSGAEQPSFDDSKWRAVTLPHDWSIEGPFDQNSPGGIYMGFMPGGVGWYRQSFTPPNLTDRQRLLIEFEGIYRYSNVWLNGQWVGARPNGFVSVQYDLTPYLIAGQPNVLAVRVDNSNQPNWRWYSGSGIYRHVWMTVADRVRVNYGGTYITTSNISVTQASIRVVTTLANFDVTTASTQLDTLIFDQQGHLVADSELRQMVDPGNLELTQDFTLAMPNLWSPDNPNLYTVYSLVRQDGVRIDDYLSTFGIRGVEFSPNKGLSLNGQSLKLKGMCIHHDLGCIGSAAHDRAIERRLTALKSIGCNALRLAHNSQAPHLLDLCDRMGFLVIAEAFDKWFGNFAGGDFGSPGWDDWWQEDLSAQLVRDRNHPSVILWSVGNEAGAVGSDDYNATLQQLVDFIHREEPSRLVTAAFAPPADPKGTLQDFANAAASSASFVDVLALNYQEQYLDLYRANIPNQVMLSTESYPYFHDVTGGFDANNSWWDATSRDFDAGEFVWVGIDYLGESAAWPSKGWPNGLIDTCGFVKARAGFFQAVWGSTPTVQTSVISDSLDIDLGIQVWRSPKSAAHWNFKGLEGKPLQVITVSNCDTVELTVNGQSQGQQQPINFANWTISWYIAYTPGTVEAIGRVGDKIVTRQLLQTAGPPATIKLKPDSDQIAADGLEIMHIEVTLRDTAGILVPDHDQRLIFVVSGPARLIGVDNGDLRSLDSFQANSRTTYQGNALAVIQSTGAPGLIVFTALANGLPSATTGVLAVAS
jgi:beta-galactosidase